MNQNFIDTMYLFKCGVRGEEPEFTHKIDIKAVYIISKKQGIWDTVFLALIKLYNKDNSILKKEEFDKLNSDFLMHCFSSSKRLIFIHKIIEKLEDNGIVCRVLKGESVSRYYNTPSARISSDADILIDMSKTKKCLEILKKEGFEVEDGHRDSHQIRCVHPLSGLIEIHNRMYGVRTEDVTFNNEITYTEDYVCFKGFDGYELKTLGYTDNALFLLMHFIKHFVHEGVGIRQLADTLLYIEGNFDKIDFERVNKHLKNLGFDTVFSYIVEIGKRYLDFPKEYFQSGSIDENLLNKILKDMEAGGLFGQDDDRKGFYNIYLNERYKRFNKGEISQYYTKRKLLRLFPKRKILGVNYSYVNKTPLLIPVAWVHRIYDGITKKKTEEKKENHIKRLEFLKELDMI